MSLLKNKAMGYILREHLPSPATLDGDLVKSKLIRVRVLFFNAKTGTFALSANPDLVAKLRVPTSAPGCVAGKKTTGTVVAHLHNRSAFKHQYTEKQLKYLLAFQIFRQ
jgi:hypothetical protein